MDKIVKFVKLCERIWKIRPDDIVAVRTGERSYLIGYPSEFARNNEEVIKSTAELHEYLGKVTNSYTVIQHVSHDGNYVVPDVDRLDRDRKIDY